MNAPRMAPNNSLSSNDGAIDPQSTGTNGWSLRKLKRWIMRATRSLPVPVSPSIMTVASVGAVFEMVLYTSTIPGEIPIISDSGISSASASSSPLSRASSARLMASSSTSSSNGLAM
ncbi:MAG: hypothetical protein WDO73_05510 [Ignavibacteriota bacterium]